MIGQIVMSQQINDIYTRLDFSKVDNGIYLVQTEVGRKVISFKIVKK
jgi:hypothetical protein